jgi:hypothetical protein
VKTARVRGRLDDWFAERWRMTVQGKAGLPGQHRRERQKDSQQRNLHSGVYVDPLESRLTDGQENETPIQPFDELAHVGC